MKTTTRPSARVIADSITTDLRRLTTLEVTLHRFVLAEFNTHRVFSRNSASSRAIPVEKQLRRVEEDPAWPLFWACEQPGMQGGAVLEGDDLLDAFELFKRVHRATVDAVHLYLDTHPEKSNRLHKSLINRLLEPFMWHTVIVSATDYDGFYDQRCSPLAQPEIRVAAEAMLSAAYENSVPVLLVPGQWHLPFINQQDHEEAEHMVFSDPTYGVHKPIDILKRVSVARCARVSYLTHDGTRNLTEDISLFNRLVTAKPMHASPLEHVATPVETGVTTPGNFEGYRQFRHDIEELIKNGG